MASALPIPTFKEEEEEWTSYLERLECYFAVKAVPDDKKVHFLICGLQPKQYQVLKDLVAPDTPVSKSFDEVTALLRKHYCGSRNPRVERTKFRQVVRKDDESLQSFSVRLKHASRFCEFGTSLDEMLVDQLIAGVHSKCIANKLLEETDGLALSFAKALKVAEEAEVNERNASMYASGNTAGRSFGDVNSGSGNVNAVSFTGNRHKSVPRNFSASKAGSASSDFKKVQNYHVSKPSDKNVSGMRCFRCNDSRHLANRCKFKSYQCKKCQRWGHIAIACKDGKVFKSQHSVEIGLGIAQDENACNYDEINSVGLSGYVPCNDAVKHKVTSEVFKPRPSTGREGNNNCNVFEEYEIFNLSNETIFDFFIMDIIY